MDVRIALASSDGINVDQHFGRSHRFMIYRLHADGYEYLETRENGTPCSGHAHDINALEQTADRLRDCRGVVVAQIGPGAIDALISRRIMAFTLPGTVEKAFAALIKTRRFGTLK